MKKPISSRIRRLTAVTLVALSGALIGITVLAQNYPALPNAKANAAAAAPAAPETHLRIGNPTVFQPFQPCRVLDTRNANGTFGGPKLVAGAIRNFPIAPGAGTCVSSLPLGVTSVVVNMTMTQSDSAGFVTAFPGGTTRPTAATVNVPAANTVANNGVTIPLAADGSMDVYASTGTHLVVDIVGYFYNQFETGDQLALSGNVGADLGVLQVENSSTAISAYAILGRNTAAAPGGNSTAVRGISDGTASFGIGVWGSHAGSGYGVFGTASTGGYGVRASAPTAGGGFAGYFAGNVTVTGTLSKGAGAFKIDHPQDPARKYLSHSFVESPDMMNVYNGNITTDEKGRAVVTMPEYFSALNADFRYQLTVMGETFAQAIVTTKMNDNKFVIKTNKPKVEVSWQVTGVRHDAYANAHRIAVEEEKKGLEIGAYLHPELFGQPEEKSIEYAKSPALFRLEHPEAKTQTAEANPVAASGSGGR